MGFVYNFGILWPAAVKTWGQIFKFSIFSYFSWINLSKNPKEMVMLTLTAFKVGPTAIKIKAITDMLTNMVFTKNYDEYHEKYKTWSKLINYTAAIRPQNCSLRAATWFKKDSIYKRIIESKEINLFNLTSLSKDIVTL